MHYMYDDVQLESKGYFEDAHFGKLKEMGLLYLPLRLYCCGAVRAVINAL